MRSLAVITMDGVLRDVATSNPIEVGRELYHGLSYLHRLAVIVTAPGDAQWLTINGFQAHQILVEPRPEDPGDDAIRRMRQLEALRAGGENIHLIVEPDPGVVSTLFRTGVTCLHFVDPVYVRPEFAPDHDGAITPWDQMVAELDRTRALRAADRRPLEDE